MSEFHVGEVAIYVKPGSPYYGYEVTITSGLTRYSSSIDHITGTDFGPSISYSISGLPQHPYSKRGWQARPKWLRKKQQKRDIDKIVSWYDCAWKPKRQTA